jgi:hypothetical protein
MCSARGEEICATLALPLASSRGLVNSTAESDLLAACRVLFGAEVRVDRRFLAGLDAATVRRRFRQRAVEVHPDRAAVLLRPQSVLLEAFKQVAEAYRALCAYLAADRGAVAPRVADRSPPARHGPEPTAVVDHRWSGPIPSRSLRLGEYLYYSGRISWHTLISALVWQARQRAPFGQVATRYGYLTPERVARVLANRRTQEKIGEAALRLRLMTPREQQVVLHAQACGVRRIGDYFVAAGLFGSGELDRFGQGVRVHNARVAGSRGCLVNS